MRRVLITNLLFFLLLYIGRVDFMGTGIYKTFATSFGETTRELSEVEATEWANMGDKECRKYKMKAALNVASTVAQVKQALVDWI